jgi:hypothetical protein
MLLVAACTGPLADAGDGDEDDFDPAERGGPMLGETSQALTLPSPIKMRSGSWWGDVATPLVNQLWGEVADATPGKSITGPQTFHWSCNLPKFDGFGQTLKLTSANFSFDSDVQQSFSASPGQVLSYTLDPSKYTAGWHEVRIRCKAAETTGSETGKVTAITAGFPVQIKGGTSIANHSGTNFVDTHGWYDRGVDYAYATILNISEVVGKPLSGVIALKLTARVSGDTTLDHFMVKIDGVIAKSPDGVPIEFHGTTKERTVYIDTRTLANGTHTLAMHSHGLETASSEKPGKQIASQIEVTIDVRN